VLGIVIYATEFVLWCGVFTCGGYFNLLPWVQHKLSLRGKKRDEAPESNPENVDAGQSNDLELVQVPSSTSVFRTPSSIVSSRISIRAQ
jgi:hypothetical protein